MATGTREGAGSREVAAWDLPGTRALRSEPQAGSPAEGPPFGTEEGCVARPSRWPGAVWLPHCGRTGEFLGGSQRRRSASAAPRGNRQHRDKPSSISMCVCVCVCQPDGQYIVLSVFAERHVQSQRKCKAAVLSRLQIVACLS